jgi:DNA-binding HxlR family transcriptional regulator
VKRGTGKSHCPINFGLEVFGDPWSLLIVRDIVYWGKHTFSEFQASAERIAPSVLTARLAYLEERGILTHGPHPDDGRKVSYGLTEAGLRLIPVLLEIAAWSAGTDPDTDAPPEWIALVAADRERMIRLITDTVRAGGAIFAGSDSVVARLPAEPAPAGPGDRAVDGRL